MPMSDLAFSLSHCLQSAVAAGLMLLFVLKMIFNRITGIPADTHHKKTGDR